jgi:hypothetical protein
VTLSQTILRAIKRTERTELTRPDLIQTIQD